MTTPVTDWRGIPIHVGDVVVYPGRHSSSMWMIEAEVVEVVPGTPDAENYWDRVQHGLKVRRLRESLRVSEVEPKIVPVQANRTTVVAEKKAIDLDEARIEIDGRAS